MNSGIMKDKVFFINISFGTCRQNVHNCKDSPSFTSTLHMNQAAIDCIYQY